MAHTQFQIPPAQPVIMMTPPTYTQSSSSSNLLPKAGRCLIGLTATNLVLAIVIFIFGFACTVTGASAFDIWDRTWYCTDGTGIWQGVYLIITSSVGVAAVRQPRARCLLVSFYVMAIDQSLAVINIHIFFFRSCRSWLLVWSQVIFWRHRFGFPRRHFLLVHRRITITPISLIDKTVL